MTIQADLLPQPYINPPPTNLPKTIAIMLSSLQLILAMSMYLSLLINEDTKFGMQMQSRQPITKLINLLRENKVIPLEATDADLKMLNGKREEVAATDLIETLNCQPKHNPKLYIFLPMQYYDFTLIAQRLKEMKSGKDAKKQSMVSDSSVADKIVAHLKRVFEEIQRKNFSKIIEMKQEGKISPMLMDIFVNYTTEYRKYWSLFEVYRQLASLMQMGEEISASTFFAQIDKKYILEKEDREDIIRRINQYSNKIEELKENSELKQKINILQVEIEHERTENKEKEQHIMRMQEERSQMDDVLASLTDRRDQLEKEIREFSSLDDKFRKVSDEKKQVEQTMANTKKEIQQLKKKIEEKDKELSRMAGFDRMSKEIDHLTDKLKQARYEITVKDAEVVQLINHYEHFELKLQKRSTFELSPSFEATATIFNDFIDLSPISSSELVYKIESHVSLRLLKITPLFIYSKHPSQYFIKNIENKPNLLLIARTVEGKIIGGFSRSALSQKQAESSQTSFLFNNDHENLIVIPLKAGKRCLVYDKDFLTFGQEELCIEQGSCWLESQAAMMNKDRLNFDWKQTQRSEFLVKKQQKKQPNRFDKQKKQINPAPSMSQPQKDKCRKIKAQDYICFTLEFQEQQ